MIFCWLYWNWKPRKVIILVVFEVLGVVGERDRRAGKCCRELIIWGILTAVG